MLGWRCKAQSSPHFEACVRKRRRHAGAWERFICAQLGAGSQGRGKVVSMYRAERLPEYDIFISFTPMCFVGMMMKMMLRMIMVVLHGESNNENNSY